MSLCIYEAYAKLRRDNQDMIKIKLTEGESKVDGHKARIVLEMISRYIHNDQPSKDDEEIDIGSMKLIDFSWRIQKKIQPHKREEGI